MTVYTSLAVLPRAWSSRSSDSTYSYIIIFHYSTRRSAYPNHAIAPRASVNKTWVRTDSKRSIYSILSVGRASVSFEVEISSFACLYLLFSTDVTQALPFICMVSLPFLATTREGKGTASVPLLGGELI